MTACSHNFGVTTTPVSHSTCVLLPGTLPAKQCQHPHSTDTEQSTCPLPTWCRHKKKEMNWGLVVPHVSQPASTEAAEQPSLHCDKQGSWCRCICCCNMGEKALHTHGTHNKKCIQSTHNQTTAATAKGGLGCCSSTLHTNRLRCNAFHIQRVSTTLQ